MQRVENHKNLQPSLSIARNPAQALDSRYFTAKAFLINILARKERTSTPPTN